MYNSHWYNKDVKVILSMIKKKSISKGLIWYIQYIYQLMIAEKYSGDLWLCGLSFKKNCD